MKVFLVIIFSLATSLKLLAQNDSINHLLQIIKQTSGIERAQVDVQLAEAYLNKNIDSSTLFIEDAQVNFPISKSYVTSKDNLLKVKILVVKAEILLKVGKLKEAEEIFLDVHTNYLPFLNISEQAECFLQLGVINDYLGNPVYAISYYNKAYKLYDNMGDKRGVSECLNNMGVVFYHQGETDKGIEYLEKSLKMRQNIATNSEKADLIMNLGSMYLLKKNMKLARAYYDEGLRFYKSDNNEWGIAYALKNLARFNIANGNYDSALTLCDEILLKHSGKSDSSGISMINAIISEIYFLKGDYKKSISHGELAYNIGSKMDVAAHVYIAAKVLKDVYKANGDYKKAFEFQTIYYLMNDSLKNNTTEKETLKQRLEHEKEVERKSYEKEILLNQSEAKRKNLVIASTTIGFLFILIFSVLLLKKFRQTNKQKAIIENQKTEVMHQKEVVDIKNREILDSITYAKRIQEAILPPQKLMKQYLVNSFVLYKPKDIVAGDFYWMENKDNLVLFAAADCTGHGVPGALVSVVCSNALNRSVKEFGLTDPGKILDKVRSLVIETFEKSDEDVKDGMDISLCAFDVNSNELKWAGANNPLWLIRNRKLIEYKANKQPIGKYSNLLPFTTNTIKLEKDDCFYIFSDGYADQFGGTEGKKFKTANMKKLIVSISDQTMNEQKDTLNRTFEAWRGSLDQLDDVCIIGVRL